MTGKTTYTEEEDALIIRGWNLGCSASQIASRLTNRSRCAVIGRIGRLREASPEKFPTRLARTTKPGPKRVFRAQKPRKPRAPRPKATPTRTPTRPANEPKEPTFKPVQFKVLTQDELAAAPGRPETKITMANLEGEQCKFPLGDPKQPDFQFCGAERIAGQPYCAFHCRISFRTVGDPIISAQRKVA